MYGHIELAGASGEPGLLAEVLLELDANGGESFLSKLFAYGQSESALAALRPYITGNDKNRRMRALYALPHGWSVGPDESWNVVLHNPDVAVRRAFVSSLNFSKTPAALKMAEQAFNDADANVSSNAATVIGNYKGPDAAVTLQRYALDKRLPVSVREHMWFVIAHQKQAVLIKEAQALVLDHTQDKRLRAAAALHLGNQDQQAWLLANLAHLEPEMQSTLLTQLSASQTPEALAKIPPLVAKLDAKLGAPILRALGARNDPAVLEVLVNALKDPRAEIQAAAQSALETCTGLSGMPMATPQNKVDPKLLYARWNAWYERFGKAPGPDLQGQIDQIKTVLQHGRNAPLDQAGLGFDPFDALLRLSMDRQNSHAALRALGQLPDARVAPALLDMSDNELFNGRSGEFSEALSGAAPSAPAIPRLLKKLDSPNALLKNFAATLLIAWRQDAVAARLADETLLKGTAFYNSVPKIVAWGHPAFLLKARSILSMPKADPEARSRATQLLTQAGQPQDVLLLLQMAEDTKIQDTSLMPALVNLALDGNADAQRGIAGLITGKNAAQRQAALKTLADDMTHHRNAIVRELPEPIAVAVRSQLSVPNSASFPDVVSILIGGGDESSLGAFNAILAKADATLVSALISAVTRTRSPSGTRFMLALIRSGKVSDVDFSVLSSALRQTDSFSKAELDAISDERKRAQAALNEAALGRVDDGLSIQVTLKTKELPFEKKESNEVIVPITVTNVGKTSMMVNDVGSIEVKWRSASDPERTAFSLATMFLGNSKPVPPNAAFQPIKPFELQPGKSATGNLVLALPGYAPGGIPHQVSFQWHWTVTVPNPKAANPYVRGYYGTPWTELSLLPDLWLVIDERTQRGR